MKTVKFYDIPNMTDGLSFDGDKTDLRLHTTETLHFGTWDEQKYKEIEERLNKFSFRGSGWAIYASYDVSGYDYWMRIMEEGCSVSFTIEFSSPVIYENQVQHIDAALRNCFETFSDLPEFEEKEEEGESEENN